MARSTRRAPLRGPPGAPPQQPGDRAGKGHGPWIAAAGPRIAASRRTEEEEAPLGRTGSRPATPRPPRPHRHEKGRRQAIQRSSARNRTTVKSRPLPNLPHRRRPTRHRPVVANRTRTKAPPVPMSKAQTRLPEPIGRADAPRPPRSHEGRPGAPWGAVARDTCPRSPVECSISRSTSDPDRSTPVAVGSKRTARSTLCPVRSARPGRSVSLRPDTS